MVWADPGREPRTSSCSSRTPARSPHEKALDRARVKGEPARQLAARELEVQRITGALRRADARDDDVAAAIDAPDHRACG